MTACSRETDRLRDAPRDEARELPEGDGEVEKEDDDRKLGADALRELLDLETTSGCFNFAFEAELAGLGLNSSPLVDVCVCFTAFGSEPPSVRTP